MIMFDRMNLFIHLLTFMLCDISGFKETSFTHAITAAGVLHQIARACALGKIASCACDVSPFSEEFQWRGCSHDLDFGAKYSRKFLNSKRDGMQGMMQAHNSKIGRKVHHSVAVTELNYSC